MFQEIEGMIQKAASGEVDQRAVGQAADQHVNSMESGQLAQHVETAANNAEQSGNTEVAQQLKSLIDTAQTNPQALRSGVVELVKENPQILTHFAPQFVRGILGSTASTDAR